MIPRKVSQYLPSNFVRTTNPATYCKPKSTASTCKNIVLVQEDEARRFPIIKIRLFVLQSNIWILSRVSILIR